MSSNSRRMFVPPSPEENTRTPRFIACFPLGPEDTSTSIRLSTGNNEIWKVHAGHACILSAQQRVVASWGFAAAPPLDSLTRCSIHEEQDRAFLFCRQRRQYSANDDSFDRRLDALDDDRLRYLDRDRP